MRLADGGEIIPSISPRAQTLREETVNALTHGLGLALSVIGLGLLVMKTCFCGDPWRIVGCSVFGASLVLLYLASTLYHYIRHPELKEFARWMDHSCIYLLIAGSYTPITLVQLRNGWGWTVFGIVWMLAIFGIALKALMWGRAERIALILYIAMGWAGVLALHVMWQSMPAGEIALILAAGVSYTSGVYFYVNDHCPYYHSIWHLFTLGGSICHFLAVFGYVAVT